MLDSSFSNVSFNNLPVFTVLKQGYVYLKNIDIQNVSDTDNPIISFQFNVHKITIENLTISNITGVSIISGDVILFENSAETITVIDQMYASNIDLYGRALVSSDSNLDQLEINNSVINDINITSSDHIIESGQIKSLLFNNIIVSNVKLNDNINADGAILYVSTLDLNSELDSVIQNIVIDNSQISFLSFGSLINESPISKSISLTNVSLTNAYYESNRALMSTDGFERNTDIHMIMSDLSFSNISFLHNGRLIEFKHQLPTYLTVTNSYFNNLNAAVLSVESSNLQNTDLKTLVQINNTVFNSINGQSNSFINVNEGGWLEVNN